MTQTLLLQTPTEKPRDALQAPTEKPRDTLQAPTEKPRGPDSFTTDSDGVLLSTNTKMPRHELDLGVR